MPEIFHDFPVFAPVERVFEAVSTPAGVDRWWARSSKGKAHPKAEWELHFGEGFDWKAVVTRCEPPHVFEFELTKAEPEWLGARVGFELEEESDRTRVRFHHTGWPEANEHYRISCYCWAMYLRILKRWAEHGEMVAWEDRLDA